ncbi:ISKra4 family transposase, partial [Mesorhizobium sp. ArgA1]
STAFVESTVNQVIAKRFAKKQQMQWMPHGVHLLMQLRTRVLDGTLDNDFKRWRTERRSSPNEAKMAA